MTKQLATFRLEPGDIAALEDLGAMQVCSEAEALRRLIPDIFTRSLYRFASATGRAPGNFREWLTRLVADQCRSLMEHDGAYPIRDHFIPRGDDGAILYYRDWLRAADLLDGAHQGPLGLTTRADWPDKPEWRLEAVPAGGEWEKAGIVGFALLRANERFTKDGTETIAPTVKDHAL